MKEIITSFVLLFTLNWQTYAQVSDPLTGIRDDGILLKHELKLDVAHVFMPVIKIEYENLLNDWSSFGAVGLIGINSDADVAIPTHQLLGLYRLYFGRNPLQGFFFEGSLGISAGNYEHGTGSGLFSQNELRQYTAFGAGIALGWKWYIPKPNIVLELFQGVGRLFHDTAGFYIRYGICVGKRF